MESPSLDTGDYLIHKGTGIGRVTQCSEPSDGDGTAPLVAFEVLRFTSRTVGDHVVTDLGVTYALPLTPTNREKLRPLMELPHFLMLLRHMSQGEAGIISKKELLSSSFTLDFFEPHEGARQAVVLHDYLFHNVLDGRPACDEYVALYQHGLSSVAFEMKASTGRELNVLRDLLEAALFVGHQSRECPGCEERDPELLHDLANYTAPARQWVYHVLKSGKLPKTRPHALDTAPFFLHPASIPHD